MYRSLPVGLLLILCCSCVTIDHPHTPGGPSHRLRGGIRVNDPSFRINVGRGELQFFKDQYAFTPFPDWTYKNTNPGTVYFVDEPTGETSASCTYTHDLNRLRVSDLVDYLNLKCRPAGGCKLTIEPTGGTVIALDASCPEVTFVVRKKGWSKSAGITITIAPGTSVDLAHAKTSPLVETYTVVN